MRSMAQDQGETGWVESTGLDTCCIRYDPDIKTWIQHVFLNNLFISRFCESKLLITRPHTLDHDGVMESTSFLVIQHNITNGNKEKEKDVCKATQVTRPATPFNNRRFTKIGEA